MNDELARLLEHPPQDPPEAADARRTAAVMARVRLVPPHADTASRSTVPRRGRAWWLLLPVVLGATFALDALSSGVDLGDGAVAIADSVALLPLLAEGALIVAILAVLALLIRPRSTP